MKTPRIARETPQRPVLVRKRCDNCPKFFQQNKPWQRFCSSACRREWDRNDCAYGRLKEKLAKDIAKEITRQMRDLAASFPNPKTFIETLKTLFVTRDSILGDEGTAVIRATVERKRAKAATR
jgi:hypothetical protein